MKQFKPGDKVKCLSNHGVELRLTVGGVYDVVSDAQFTGSNEIAVRKCDQGHLDVSFRTSRFELATPKAKFAPGDRVTSNSTPGSMFRAIIAIVYPPGVDIYGVEHGYTYGLNNLVSGAGMGLYKESELRADDVNSEPGQVCPLVQSVAASASGVKYDDAKPDMALLSSIAVNKIALVMTYGAKKYDANNWRKGMAWTRLLSACLRHVMAFIGGENKDPETGLSHLAHACCCLMFLLEYEETHAELDNRFKPTKQKGA